MTWGHGGQCKTQVCWNRHSQTLDVTGYRTELVLFLGSSVSMARLKIINQMSYTSTHTHAVPTKNTLVAYRYITETPQPPIFVNDNDSKLHHPTITVCFISRFGFKQTEL